MSVSVDLPTLCNIADGGQQICAIPWSLFVHCTSIKGLIYRVFLCVNVSKPIFSCFHQPSDSVRYHFIPLPIWSKPLSLCNLYSCCNHGHMSVLPSKVWHSYWHMRNVSLNVTLVVFQCSYIKLPIHVSAMQSIKVYFKLCSCWNALVQN